MEKSPEIADGHYTAEYWEYDSRSARRWNVDPKSNISFSPYATFECNPIAKTDGKGDTAIVTITADITGTAKLTILRSGDIVIEVNSYSMTITDTEDPKYIARFSVTRDAFAKTGETDNGNIIAQTVSFEPRVENTYILERVFGGGYPESSFPSLGSGAAAYLVKSLAGQKELTAMNNPASVSINPPLRSQGDLATDVMIHVGGVYQTYSYIPFMTKNNVARSAGCFGIVDGDNPDAPSNSETKRFDKELIERRGDVPIMLKIEPREYRKSTIEVSPRGEVQKGEVESTSELKH